MYFRILFVLNRVVISNPQRLAYTQISVEYPPGGGGGGGVSRFSNQAGVAGVVFMSI